MQPFDAMNRLETVGRLDRPADALAGAAHRLVRPQQVRDLLHGVWLGHPVHPLSVQLPIGAWFSAGVLDLLPGTEPATRVLTATGVAAAGPAVLTGLVDYSETMSGQRRVGLVHATANATALTCYAASLVMRPRTARLLRFLGLAAVSVGGALGGHLAYRQATGANHVQEVPHVFPSGWHDVGTLAELPEDEPVRREVDAVPLVLVRRGPDVHVLSGRCPHLSGPLYEGELDRADGGPTLTCPWHGSCFDLTDGSVVHGPATASAPVFETRVDDGRVRVRLPV